MREVEAATRARYGPYRVVRKLGAGGMGSVWEAEHERLHKRVAIKTLHPEVMRNAEAVARFVREGRAASRLRHSHVVDVTDVAVDDGVPYLVMAYLDGEPLSALIERRGALDLASAVAVALPVMDALQAAHDAGIVHRDLKPDNVFLVRQRDGSLHPVLLDFGISRLEGDGDPRLTQTATLMGTPYYMSPEQARGAKNVDARSDHFSLGLVLHEALTGTRAVEGTSLLEIVHKIATRDFPKLAESKPELPKSLASVVDRMTARDPSERFEDLREPARQLLPLADPRTNALFAPLLDAVDAAAETLPSSARATPAPGPTTTLGAAARESTSTTARQSRAAYGVGAAVSLAALASVALALASMHGNAAEPGPLAAAAATPDVYHVRVRAEPPSATLTLDDGPSETGTLSATLPRDGMPHTLAVRAEGHVAHVLEFIDLAPISIIRLEPVPEGHVGDLEERSRMTTSGLVRVARARAPGTASAVAAPLPSSLDTTPTATGSGEPDLAAEENDGTDPSEPPHTRPAPPRRDPSRPSPEPLQTEAEDDCPNGACVFD